MQEILSGKEVHVTAFLLDAHIDGFLERSLSRAVFPKQVIGFGKSKGVEQKKIALERLKNDLREP